MQSLMLNNLTLFCWLDGMSEYEDDWDMKVAVLNPVTTFAVGIKLLSNLTLFVLYSSTVMNFEK